MTAPGTRVLVVDGSSSNAGVRARETSYDALGRAVTVTTYAPTAVAETTTVYTRAGRTDRTSALAPVGTPDANRAWTKTVYDALGRAIRTLAHVDTGGAVGFNLASFEADVPLDVDGWSTTNASAVRDAIGDANTGLGALKVTPSAANGGVTWTLVGSTSSTAMSARVRVWVPSGAVVSAKINSGTVADSTTGANAWQTLTPSATVASGSATLTITSSTTAAFRIDDAAVWPTNTADRNLLASETAYDSAGRIASSVLPPGSPSSEDPLVTTTGYDPSGRATIVTVNPSGADYPLLVNGTGSIAGYWPLDALGATASDASGTKHLARGGSIDLGVSGAIDEPRTAARFAGAGTFAITTASPVLSTSAFAMEAWIRTDTIPSGETKIAAWNGNATAGFGIGVDTTGHAVALTAASGTLTPIASAALVTDGAWHHVAITRVSNLTHLYLDGAEVGTAANNTPGTITNGFAIGGMDASTRRFTGDVDEVAVYNSAATLTGRAAAARPTDVTNNITSRTSFDRFGRTGDSWATSPAAEDGTSAPLVRTHHAYDGGGRLLATTLLHREHGQPSAQPVRLRRDRCIARLLPGEGNHVL